MQYSTVELSENILQNLGNDLMADSVPCSVLVHAFAWNGKQYYCSNLPSPRWNYNNKVLRNFLYLLLQYLLGSATTVVNIGSFIPLLPFRFTVGSAGGSRVMGLYSGWGGEARSP